MAALRELDQPLICALNRGDEIQAEFLRVFLVVSRSGDELSFGLRMELDASHRSVERTFLKT